MASGDPPAAPPAALEVRRGRVRDLDCGAGDLRAAERAVLHVQNHLVARHLLRDADRRADSRARFAAGAGPCARPRDDKSQVPAPLLVSAALVCAVAPASSASSRLSAIGAAIAIRSESVDRFAFA